MSNLLTAGLAYDPYFYANSALRALYKRLGMAFYVNRQLEAEKASGKGSTIQLRRPRPTATQSMPIAEAAFADRTPEYDNMVIGTWEGDGFKLTDKEKALSPDTFVREHITPVAVAIADSIDQDLAGLILEVPWIVDDDDTNPYKDFSALQAALFNQKAPPVNPTDYAYQIDGVLQQRYQTDPTFVTAATADPSLQRDGILTIKYGMRIFANQNSPTYVSGTGALSTPIVSGAHAIGSRTLAISGTTGSGTWKKGTVFTLTGYAQKYAVTTDVVVGSTGATAAISPALQTAVADTTVVAFDQTANTTCGCVFHRDAFALVMQPLEAAGPGILSATVQDPITGLTLRSRIWGSGGLGATIWAIDALWGVKTLDPNMAVRLRI